MSGTPTAFSRIVSVAIWLVAGSFLILGTTVLATLYRIVPPDRIQWLERLYCRLQIALTFNRAEYHVHPSVDPGTQYLFLQNHSSHLDYIAMYNATPHFKQGVELESHFRYPFYGWFMKGRGTIPVPVNRVKAMKALRSAIAAEVQNGHSVLGFPEGHRTLTGRVGRFYDGLFRIAIELGVPIVPVAVTGLYDVLRKGSLVIRPGNVIRVFVEEPIDTAELDLDDLALLRDRVRSVMAARVDAYFSERG